MDYSRPFIENSYKELMLMKVPVIPCAHAFTTRFGGVSEGYLESLNLGENFEDSEENVRENYRRLLEALASRELAGAEITASEAAGAWEGDDYILTGRYDCVEDIAVEEPIYVGGE